jgi:hypothetical protein
VLTGGLSVFCGIFFGGVFVAEHGQGLALGWALGAGVLTAAAVAMYRHKRLAEIREPQAVDLNSASDPTSDSAAEDDDDEKAGWDLRNLLIAALVVPPLVLIGLLSACWLPVLIITAFAVQTGAASSLGIALAIGCTFAVMGAVEYGGATVGKCRWSA